MKAQHVVTGKDRDKAYNGVFGGICLAVVGIAIIGGTGAWLWGGGVILFGALWFWVSILRLKGEI